MKKPSIKKIFTTIYFLAILLTMSGCGKSPKEQLLGTWQPDGTQNAIDYFEDSSLRLIFKDGSSVNGNWLILQDGSLKSVYSQAGITRIQVDKLDFDGSDMIQTGENGKVTRFKRLK